MILISTESGAEGVNMQFCSLLINYDLPWNPQRIEQRIGRIHRYGQKCDVVIINFLNKGNRADERVFELLNENLKLFSRIFGASDEVLGAIESEMFFEQRNHSLELNLRMMTCAPGSKSPFVMISMEPLPGGTFRKIALIPYIDMEKDDFWKEVKRHAEIHNMDEVLAYMHLMIREAKKKRSRT